MIVATTSLAKRHWAVEEARQKRAFRVRADYLIEIREKAGLTQVEVAEATEFRQRVSKSGPLAGN